MRFLKADEPIGAKRTKSTKKASPGKTERPSATRKKQPIKRASPKLLKIQRGLIFGISALCLFALPVAAGYWAFNAGHIDRMQITVANYIESLAVRSGLAVKEVLVSGRSNLDSQRLLEALDIHMGQPLLSVDPKAAQDRIEALGWVKAARVERRMSGQIIIQLTERQPVAIWHDGHHHQLVDLEGNLIGQDNLSHFRHLKVVSGENAQKHIDLLLRILATVPDMRSHVISAVWVGDRRWNLNLENGITVRLPETDPIGAWLKLADLQKDHDVLDREVESIDLRQEDRLIIQVTNTGKLQMKGEDQKL